MAELTDREYQNELLRVRRAHIAGVTVPSSPLLIRVPTPGAAQNVPTEADTEDGEFPWGRVIAFVAALGMIALIGGGIWYVVAWAGGAG